MKILVDADASPVKESTEALAKHYDLPLIHVVNHHHMITSDYGEVVVVDDMKDAVDFQIIKLSEPSDIVITQDYGLASLVLANGCNVLHPVGFEYTHDNIDQLLADRHQVQVHRKRTQRNTQHKKRTEQDNQAFRKQLQAMIERS